MANSSNPRVSHRKKNLEEGFLKAEEIPESKKKEKEGEKEEEAKSGETEEDKDQLPFETVHKVIRATCLVALVLWFVIIVFLSIVTRSNPFNTLLGLSPVLLTIILTYILVDKYHMENGFLLILPFILTALLYMLGKGGMMEGIDYSTLSGVNIIFGVLFEAVILVHYNILRKQEEVETKKVKEEKLVIKLDNEEGVKTFVSCIEDKVKAINAAIGRVYSVRRGGTEPLRKKIKIDAAHYNEFNELKNEKPAQRKATAIKLLNKIKDRLELLQKPEKEVFDKDDMDSLLRIERDKKGNDKVINVLIKSDKDPVKAYYEGAMKFCEGAIKVLEKEEKKR